jgi:hypothetical protein
MTLRHFISASLAALLFAASPAHAGEGHDHGPAASPTGPALPRFAATSEAFELVGVLNGKRIALYLDRAADNSPVADAQIELEIGGVKHTAAKHDADEFEVMLPTEPKAGVLPVTATVTVGKEVDLLAGELDIHDAAPADEAVHVHSWKEYAGWGAAGVAALAAIIAVFVFGRRRMSSNSVQAGGAA